MVLATGGVQNGRQGSKQDDCLPGLTLPAQQVICFHILLVYFIPVISFTFSHSFACCFPSV